MVGDLTHIFGNTPNLGHDGEISRKDWEKKVPGADIPLTSYELLFFFWKKQNKNIFYTSDDECKKNICH